MRQHDPHLADRRAPGAMSDAPSRFRRAAPRPLAAHLAAMLGDLAAGMSVAAKMRGDGSTRSGVGASAHHASADDELAKALRAGAAREVNRALAVEGLAQIAAALDGVDAYHCHRAGVPACGAALRLEGGDDEVARFRRTGGGAFGRGALRRGRADGARRAVADPIAPPSSI